MTPYSEALIRYLDSLPEREAMEIFLQVCASSRWAKAMLAARPFHSPSELTKRMAQAFSDLGPDDWQEAFKAHPKIGAKPEAHDPTAKWSAEEQSGVASAADSTLDDLKKFNILYEKKFGFIFLICATGLSAAAMLESLKHRIRNDHTTELAAAAHELILIARLRLLKVEPKAKSERHTLSTHVLDTTKGRPAAKLKVTLERAEDNQWLTIGHFVTDADGRVPRLHGPNSDHLENGDYRLSFAAGAYLSTVCPTPFYDIIPVSFRLSGSGQHFHVPLLLSPFGYSTYRGS